MKKKSIILSSIFLLFLFNTVSAATVVSGLPGTPSISFVARIQDQNKASVSFVASTSDIGKVVSYVVTSNPAGLTATSTKSPVIVSGLLNDVAYSFQVKAVNSVGSSGLSGFTNQVQFHAPLAPTIRTATLIEGQNKASVSFNLPTNDGGLTITEYDVTSNIGNLTAIGTSSPIIVSGLLNGTSYTFSVKAKNSDGFSPDSKESNSVKIDVPSAPIIGNATLINGQNKASISFTPPVSSGGLSISEYDVTSNTGNLISVGTSSPIIVSGLLSGTAYTFSVKAKNSVGFSVDSKESNSVKIGIPLAPAIGTADLIDGQNKASVSFSPTTESGSEISSYTVNMYSGSTVKGTFTGTSSPIIASGLLQNVEYRFKVSATNSYGTSPLSALSNIVFVGKPGKPTIDLINFVKDPNRTGRAIIFAEPSSISTPKASYYTAYSNPAGLTATSSTSIIEVSGLVKDKSYTFTVKATNSYGTSDSSSPSDTIRQTVPSAPEDIIVNNWVWGGDFGSIKVSWSPSLDGGSNITSYKIYANGIQANDPNGNPAVASTSPTRIGKLSAGVKYTFAVSATNALGTSALSKASPAFTGKTDSNTSSTLGGCTKTVLANGDYYYECNGDQLTQTARLVFGDYINLFNVVGGIATWDYYDGYNKKLSHNSINMLQCDSTSRPAVSCNNGKLDLYTCSVSKNCATQDLTKKFFNVGIPYDSVLRRTEQKFESWSSNVIKLAASVVASAVLAFTGLGTVLLSALYSVLSSSLGAIGVVIPATLQAANTAISATSIMTVAGTDITVGTISTTMTYVSYANQAYNYTQDALNIINKDYDITKPDGKAVPVDVCQNIPGLQNGDHFYVLADTVGSYLATYRYYLYQFTKGKEDVILFDPLGRKRNVNSAVYNGGCTVRVSNVYMGAPTDYSETFVKIVEIGKVPTNKADMCKSQIVTQSAAYGKNNENSLVFWERQDGKPADSYSLLGVQTCGENGTNEISDKYINGSKYAETVHIDRNSGYPVKNICNQLGISPSDLNAKINNKESFYVMENLSGAWIPLAYPIYQFTFGQSKNSTYWSNGNKNIYSTVEYDGVCNIAFNVVYSGSSTKYPNAYVSYYETGIVKDAKCYSSLIKEQSVIRTKYPISYYAPFLTNMHTCLNENSCSVVPAWTSSYTFDCRVGDSLTASPSTIHAGASSTLAWYSLGGDSVSAPWTSKKSATGSEVINNIQNTTDYVMSFFRGTNTTHATATVTVLPPSPCAGKTNCPSVPNTQIVKNGCQQAIKLDWQSYEGVSKYQLYKSVNDSNNFVKINEISSSSPLTYKDIDVTASSTYYYKIKYCDVLGGCSDFSGSTNPVVIKASSDTSCQLNKDGTCFVTQTNGPSNTSKVYINKQMNWNVDFGSLGITPDNSTVKWSVTGTDFPATGTENNGLTLPQIYTTVGLKNISATIIGQNIAGDEFKITCSASTTVTIGGGGFDEI